MQPTEPAVDQRTTEQIQNDALMFEQLKGLNLQFMNQARMYKVGLFMAKMDGQVMSATAKHLRQEFMSMAAMMEEIEDVNS